MSEKCPKTQSDTFFIVFCRENVSLKWNICVRNVSVDSFLTVFSQNVS